MLNVPMPLSGSEAMNRSFDGMSNHLARLLASKIQREQMAQQNEQFGQSFGLQQAQENRLAALSPYQQQLLQAQAAQAQQESAQLAFQQNLFKSLLGQSGGAPAASNMLSLPSTENNQANPVGGQSSQAAPAGGGAPGFENMMNNPLLAGMFKKITGIDPYNESPSAKSQRDFQDFTRKEEYKTNKPKDLLSDSRIDALQKSVIGIDQVLPMLEELKKTKPGALNGWWSPSNQAEYEGIVSNIIEPLLASKGLTGTVENSHAMRATVERKRGEDFDSWLKRIDNEIKIVKRIKKENTQMLKEGKVIPKSFENDKTTVKFNPITGKFE